MRLLILALLSILPLSLAVPLASASHQEDCRSPGEVGLVPWTTCTAGQGVEGAHAAVCRGWALVWGPDEPCPSLWS